MSTLISTIKIERDNDMEFHSNGDIYTFYERVFVEFSEEEQQFNEK